MDFDEYDNLVLLTDQEGNEVKFEFLDLIEFEQEEYVILLNVEEKEKEETPSEILILRMEDSETDDREAYSSVEDKRILNEVFEIFKKQSKGKYNFI